VWAAVYTVYEHGMQNDRLKRSLRRGLYYGTAEHLPRAQPSGDRWRDNHLRPTSLPV
jgi:hypothetical protein